MNDTTHSETSVTFTAPAGDYPQAGSEVARQVCNQGQTVAKAMTD